MTQSDRHRRRVIGLLYRLVSDEDRQLKRTLRVARFFGIAGGFLAASGVFALFQETLTATSGLVFGLIGGLGIGLSIFLHSSWAQWPVLKEFVDSDAIRNRYESD